MRKRLIGKAFAVAMTGAMAFTATPVTANIFNVAHVVKAAEADQAEEWTYCYVGLTWAEYWANEGVYNADNTSSSDVEDSRAELDKGGYDVVTRASVNHGLHRGSYQCMATIYTTDTDGKTGPEYKVSYWSEDGKTIHLTNGSSVKWNKGVITDDGTTYNMSHYEVSGIKYVPVAVKTSQLADLKAKYQVVENNGTLVGGYSENNLKAYTLTANVTKDTNGLKVATENENGTFSFAARQSGKDSGLTTELKTATDVTATVKSGDGAYGEFLRVDLNGKGYGDLGSNMQAVRWTYYGNDKTYSKSIQTYGTKFAADNWMHKSMGIQLGLTESDRCKLPEGTDGTGYWELTVYALGYADTTFKFEVTSDNIAKHEFATDSEISTLRATIAKANALDTSDYCPDQDKNWEDMKGELKEANDALERKTLYAAAINEANTHLNDAIDALVKHDYKETTTPATTSKNGSIVVKCSNCGDVKSTTTIAKIKSIALNKTSFTENGKVQKATVVAKDSANKTIAASNYTVSYSNSNSKKPGTYTATVKFNGKNYTGTKKLTYKINAKAPAKTTVKLSKAKKTSLKASWSKVANATSYEVQYGTSKSFKGAKTVKVSSKSSSKVLTKLKKNKKYYVRVRAVRTVKVDNKNTTLRASWSSAKNLKTKKK